MRKKLLAIVLTLAMLLTLAAPFSAAEDVSAYGSSAAPVLTTTVFAEDWRESINIRFFLDGVLTALPLENIVLTVDGVQVPNIRDYAINIAGWQTTTNAIFISKLVHNWQHIVVNISAYGQTVTHEFTNNMFVPPPPPPVLTTTVFAEDWRETINIRFFLDGVLSALPLEDIVFIVDGVEIPDIRAYTINVAGWQTETSAVFISKLVHNWQHMIVHISAYGQTVTHEFINNMFVAPPELTTTVHAEDWRETINIRFFLDGVLTALPLEDIVFIVDGVEVPDIRAFTINVAGWQTETSAVFINKMAHNWHRMTVNISAYGQTVTHEFVNNFFVSVCETEGHIWCGETGIFEQRVVPICEDEESYKLWWFEICSRACCDFALPIADIYLEFVGDWGAEPTGGQIDRLINVFNTSGKGIFDTFNAGIVMHVEYARATNNTTAVAGNRITIQNNHFTAAVGTANYWITDVVTRALVQLAQGPYLVPFVAPGTANVANAPTAFPAWLVEGMRDFGRAWFGLYNEQANWAPSANQPGHWLRGQNAGKGAFFVWIAENYGLEVIAGASNAASEGRYPLRRSFSNLAGASTWVCDDDRWFRTNLMDFVGEQGIQENRWSWHYASGRTLQQLWDEYRDEVGGIPVELPPGFATRNEAAAAIGRNIAHGRVHVPTPANTFAQFNAAESPPALFDGTLSKYGALLSNGAFRAVWMHDAPFVADGFLWQTGNDNASFPRRMGDGWTVSGTNTDPRTATTAAEFHAIEWTVLYTGRADDYQNLNHRWFSVSFENTQPFQFYMILATTSPDGRNEVQLSSVYMTGNWQCTHNFVATVTAPTCGAEGFTAMICTICELEDTTVPRWNFTPKASTGHTGSGCSSNMFLGDVPAEWASKWWTAYISFEQYALEQVVEPWKWWFEYCTTCGEAVPVHEIYLEFRFFSPQDNVPGNRYPWTHLINFPAYPAAEARAELMSERHIEAIRSTVDRLIYTFNVVWIPISDWIQYGTINRVNYVLDRTGIAWASGLQSGVSYYWLTDRPWDIDSMTHELIHNAQLYSNVPLHIHENVTDYGRVRFGIFNDMSQWANPGQRWGDLAHVLYVRGSNDWFRGYHHSYRIGARWWWWINEQFGGEYGVIAQRTAGMFNGILQSLPEGHVNAGGFAHIAQAMNYSCKENGRYFPDGRQYIWLTGYSQDELWQMFMYWSQEAFAKVTADWDPGYMTLAAAAGERTIRTNPIFMRGGVGQDQFRSQGVGGVNPPTAAGQIPQNLFNGAVNNFYMTNLHVQGPFWVEWRYEEAFVADSFIIQMANDATHNPRRMHDGWILAGMNPGDADWTVIYVGSQEDMQNFNSRFYRIDLSENTRAFSMYRLFSDLDRTVPLGPQFRATGDCVTIRLANVWLTGVTAEIPCCDLEVCILCTDCGICIGLVTPCDICDARCDCECVACPVCDASCDADCVPCTLCPAICDSNCVACPACAALCSNACDCLFGALAVVHHYGRANNITIAGGSYRLGTAHVSGVGMVNIAIPASHVLPNLDWFGGLIDSERVNFGQVVRIGLPVTGVDTPHSLYRIQAGGVGVDGLVANATFNGLRREATFGNAAAGASIANSVNWLFNSGDAHFVNTRGNSVIGRVTAYADGTITIANPLRGATGPFTFELPGNGQASIWNFPWGRGGSANPLTFPVDRHVFDASDLRAINNQVTTGDPHSIYAVIMHDGNINNASVVFIRDFQVRTGSSG